MRGPDRLPKPLGAANNQIGESTKALNDEFAFPETWKDHEYAQSLSAKRQRLTEDLTVVEEEWLRRG